METILFDALTPQAMKYVNLKQACFGLESYFLIRHDYDLVIYAQH